MTDGSPHNTASLAGPGTSAPRSTRTRRHPLLAPFPLAVMAVATFLIVFAVLMARLRTQGITGVPSTAGPAVVERIGGVRVRATASGGLSSSATSAGAPVASPGPAAVRPAILTGTSGSERGGDD